MRYKNILINLSLAGASLALLFLFLEFFVFRYILLASDFPRVCTLNKVVRYCPNQSGVLRIRDEINALFNINSNGWNSGHETYLRKKRPGIKRIAIIGDSYVEGFSVDYDQSLAEVLERKLGPKDFEVYRFGIGGAPMSQYLYMLRREVVSFSPDMVIIVLSHNDFDESYAYQNSLYSSYFMKLIIEGQQVTGEKPPVEYRKRWYTSIRYSATWRYLHIRRQVQFSLLKNLLLEKNPSKEYNLLSSGLEDASAATEYVFRQMKVLAKKMNFELLVLIDGDRGRIYRGGDGLYDYNRGVLRLNLLAKKKAQALGIEFIDLHPLFAREYSVTNKKFEFTYDFHWNSEGHAFVADTIYKRIKNKGMLMKNKAVKHLT